MAGVQYNFPELPIEEITQQFHMVFPDLGVNENDFKAPKVRTCALWSVTHGMTTGAVDASI